MKKVLIAALAAIAVLTGTAQAQILNSQPVPWNFPANVTTGCKCQLTKALAAGGTDTTAWVGTKGWFIPTNNAIADTLVVARFLVHVDTTGSYAPGQTTLTAIIDGAAMSAGGVNISGGGYPQVNFKSISYTLTPTTGDAVMSVPIVLININQSSQLGASTWGSIPPYVRLRLATSAAINAAACTVQFLGYGGPN